MAGSDERRVGIELAVFTGLPLSAFLGGYGLTLLTGWPTLLRYLFALWLLLLSSSLLLPRRGDVATWPEARQLCGRVVGVLLSGLGWAVGVYFVLLASGLLPVLSGVVAGVTLWFAVGRARTHAFGPRQPSSAFLRGRRLLSCEEAERSLARAAATAPEDEPFRPRWGGKTLPARVASTHFAVVGATGSGKTTLIRLLLQSVLPAVGQPGTRHRAMVYDDKQTLLPALHAMDIPGEILLLNPLDRRCRAWDIAADVNSPAVAAQVAKVLVPEADVREPFFPNAVRLLLRDLMVVFNRRAAGRWTFRDLVLATLSIPRMEYLLSLEPLSDGLREVFNEPRLSLNLLASMLVDVGDFRTAAACWARAEGPPCSLREWVRSGGQVLVLSNDDEVRKELTAINRVLFDRAMQLLLAPNRPADSGRTWLVLDELREAGRFDMLASGLLRCRERDVCCVLGFQDNQGLQIPYQSREQVNEMLGQCSHKALLALSSPETAEWASAVIGKSEFREYHQAWSKDGLSVTESVREQPTVLPAEFLDLRLLAETGDLEGYFVTPSAGGVTRERLEGSWLWSQLKQLSPTDPAYVAPYDPRPPSDQELLDWTAEDLARLNLPDMPAGRPTVVQVPGGLQAADREPELDRSSEVEPATEPPTEQAAERRSPATGRQQPDPAPAVPDPPRAPQEPTQGPTGKPRPKAAPEPRPRFREIDFGPDA